MENNCKNCINSKVVDNIKSGKYRNFVIGCNLYPQMMCLDHWKRTDALTCKDFKEKN